jgi:1-acyl-sn-glycerol-3-phosphate acyltransferase
MSTDTKAGTTPYAGLPETDSVAHPDTFAIRHLRWVGAVVIRRWYRIRLHGASNVPTTGPVILCSNHIGVVDGPLLAILGPRPVHALTKIEMFKGFLARFLPWAGQIPLDRSYPDKHAISLTLKVLREGNVTAIYPEGARGDGELRRFTGGAAYAALVTGAPVVPVLMFGSRLPGHGAGKIPPRGAKIDIVFGPPFQVPAQDWPRTKEQVGHVSKLLQEHMLVHLDEVRAETGLELPGPLPSM